MKNNMFLIKENSDGTLIFLSNKNDPYQMNWIEGDHAWGTVIVPEGIKSSGYKNCYRGRESERRVQIYE